MTDFTHGSYAALLEYIGGLGRPIVSFRDVPKSGPYVILRHDIDYSPLKAVEMAALDHRAGVTSSFFVLLTCSYYNALADDNVRYLKEIAEMGHEIGLHYDCTGFERLQVEDQQRRIATLVGCLEDALGIEVAAIAQHKPSESKIRPEFPGFVDAYSPPYFQEIAYISDSRMMFRVDDVYAFFRNNSRSQALIHPIWWYPVRKSREEVFQHIKNRICSDIDELISSDKRAIEESM